MLTPRASLDGPDVFKGVSFEKEVSVRWAGETDGGDLAGGQLNVVAFSAGENHVPDNALENEAKQFRVTSL